MSQTGNLNQNDKEVGEHRAFLCSFLFSQHKINVSWCVDSLHTTSDINSALLLLPHSALALQEWEPQFVKALMIPRNEWGSLLTLRSGCCRDRHRRDIARYCRLSHKPVKRRREMRSYGPVPSLASRSKTEDSEYSALLDARKLIKTQRTRSSAPSANWQSHLFSQGCLVYFSSLTHRVQKVRKSVNWHKGSICHLFEALGGIAG